MKFLLMATVVLLPFATPAAAQLAACSCQNLSDLQGEYKNAVYLEGYMRDLATHLKALEDRLQGLHLSTNADPDQNLDIFSASMNERAAYEAAHLNLPVAPNWYHGPERVRMVPRTCTQNQADLDAMTAGSNCEAIAAMALAHEARHRALCSAMGIDAYWGRMPSEIALEEAGDYKLQAEDIKAELRRVLDVSQVKLKGIWRHTLDAQGQMVVTYVYETQSGDIGGASGGDTWTMAGTGETSNSIEKVSIAGMTCTSTGAVRRAFDVAMTTDGLTFGLEMTTRTTSDDLVISCRGGMGMSLPSIDTGSGVLTTGQTLHSGDNSIPSAWASAIKAMMTSAGVTITGDPEMVLSVSCNAP